jgi:GH15 family glucan-1,4-alpha-glucosidase
VVASPTFSLPEFIGGTRNWYVTACAAQLASRRFSTTETRYRDYRASWIRDASFTLYALIRLGFTREADGTFIVHLSGT